MRIPRSPWTLFVAFVLAVTGLATLAPEARADDTPSSWKVTRYATTATFATDGTARVRTELSFDFASDAGHGPYVTLTTRNSIPGDRGHWRQMDIDQLSVTSPSGAPSQVSTSTSGSSMTLRIGDKKKKVSGVQRYVITYRARGIPTPANFAGNPDDEVRWMVIGTGWQVPLDDVDVTLNLPAATTRTTCLTPQGPGDCSATDSGSRSVTIHANHLAKGRSLTAVAELPAGTFVGATPRLTHRTNALGALNPAGRSAIPSLVVLLLGGGALAAVRRRRERLPEVAVRFTPPDKCTPGEAGALLEAQAKQQHVIATVIDLAVRGHIRLRPYEVPEGEKVPRRIRRQQQWSFTRVGNGEKLARHESAVRGALFGSEDSITTVEMADKEHTGLVSSGEVAIMGQVVGHRQWFTRNPSSTRARWMALGLGVITLGGIAFVVGITTWDAALPGLLLVVLGAVLGHVGGSASVQRTPQGLEKLAEVRGFRLYLTTAEADQIRFEEGIDVFSRYLPWAITFGVADRWARIFEQLEREGRYHGDTGWCGVTPGTGFASFSGVGNSITSSMQASISAASADASSGSSGGGGGSVGGGGGGGW